MTSEANASCLREREMRARGTGDGVFANDNCRRLNDNYEPRQMDITNLATTGRSSCRRPAILVDVDQLVGRTKARRPRRRLPVNQSPCLPETRIARRFCGGNAKRVGSAPYVRTYAAHPQRSSGTTKGIRLHDGSCLLGPEAIDQWDARVPDDESVAPGRP